jgi:hypothetical protein
MVGSYNPHTFSKKSPLFRRITQPSPSRSSKPHLTLKTKVNYGNYLPTDTASCPRRLESSATPLWESQISHLALTFEKWNSSWVTVSAKPVLTFTCKASLTQVYQLSKIKFSNVLMFLWLPSDVAQCITAVPMCSSLSIHLHFARISFLIFSLSLLWISVSSELSFTK